MPCATIHLRLAGSAWTAWEDGRLAPPFSLDAGTRDAFLHGSLAPDLGFVPGVERLVSDLAHYHRPADLARAVMAEAGTEREHAFAWGWVAHVLGDVALHPEVGRAVGEELYRDRTRRVNAVEDVETHVSIEVGLDAQVLSAHGDTPAPPARPFFDGRSAGLLVNALRKVYGLTLSPERLASWHRTAVIRTRRWPAALRALSRAYPLVPGSRVSRVDPWRPTLRVLRLFARRGTAASGFFRPRPAPGWLLESVQAEARTFPARLAPFLERGLLTLENRNLESGDLETENGESHPETSRIRRTLERLVPASVRTSMGPSRETDGPSRTALDSSADIAR